MDAQQAWEFLVNALLFFFAFKIGQISVWVKLGVDQRTEMQKKLAEVRTTSLRPVITVEEINGVYYAYDGNDFLAQGKSPDELGSIIANRYPQKYKLARVEIKA